VAAAAAAAAAVAAVAAAEHQHCCWQIALLVRTLVVTVCSPAAAADPLEYLKYLNIWQIFLV
jgi:hypothetical protein